MNSTIPYKLSVRAESETFLLSGASSSLLSLGSAGGNANLNKVNFLTTEQELIHKGDPVIDADIDVGYSIQASPSLITAKRGTYQLKLIYCLELQQ